MARTREELIDNLMDEYASFILGRGAGPQASITIRTLLRKTLEDENTFEETWKKFFREGE